MKWTKTQITTLREAPAEAEIPSHQLLLRAGLVRKLAGGVYSFLPLGLRALRKVERIIREEMDRAGALELLMPALQPCELWEKSGRLALARDVFFSVRDHQNRPWVLGPTHEEVVTSIAASEIQSYKQLPRNFYQIQTKYRDEIRPRFGLMRAREFIMKDAYSFDVDDAASEKSYREMYDTYCRIFDRVGLNYRVVEADTGVMGGSFSHEFSVPSEIGESEIVYTEDGTYAAAMEKATSQAAPRENPDLCPQPEEFDTPGIVTIEALSQVPYGVAPIDQVKTLVYLVDSKLVLFLLRGDHQLNEAKLAAYLKAGEFRPATEGEIVEALGAKPGSLGARGVKGKASRVVADLSLKGQRGMTTGANRDGVHIRHVDVERDLDINEWADLRSVNEGETSADGKQVLKVARAIEVGHVFKLGTKYSKALNAEFLDADGTRKPMVMGCYGIGVTRTLQAVLEQNHDANGIIWPYAIAPYQVTLIELDPKDEAVHRTAEMICSEAEKAGFELLWDDRDERPGVKFKDADLIGIPWRIVIGARSLANGRVELKSRCGAASELVPPEQAISRLMDLVPKR